MKLKKFAVVLSIAATMSWVAVTPIASAATTINGHSVVLDGSGRIIPWTANPGDGYGTVIDSAWAYLLNRVPLDSGNRKPAYYSQSYINPDTQLVAGWPHNPAGLYSMLVESALKYYAYSGDMGPVTLARQVASWQLTNGMTKATDNWAKVPYSSGDAGSLTYQGASYGDRTGVGDGTGYLQPDKVGAMGLAWAQLYEFDGDTDYRDAAIAAADALASHVRTGNATQSPWPFRVNAATGAIREQYTANVIDPIQLFDALIELGVGNTDAYQKARQTAWDWLMTYPMKNNNWCNYFEDVAVQSELSNDNQLIPMMTARYLLTHLDSDPNWETHVRGLLAWVDDNFAVADNGATTIREQNAFYYPMGSHTSRYASVNALLAQLTGDEAAKTEAYYSLNWSTYMARENGVVIDGPQVNNQWFTDGYGDYIRHFLTSMQAFPEWAPSGQTHLTGSTSLVTNVSFAAGAVSYTTADQAATESLRLNFVPNSVVVDGKALNNNSNLDQEGWNYDPGTGVMRIRHDSGTAVRVQSGIAQPGNAAPSITLTGPANGSSFAAGSDVTLTASASDQDGTIGSVQFFNGNSLLSTSTSAPFRYTWPKVGSGNYVLTAVATDNGGATGRSGSATITVTAPSTLPTPWQNGDIGPVGVPGSATSGDGIFTINASGVDIWDQSDSFHYLYQPLQGDGQITARIVDQGGTDGWALAGAMIREDLSESSRHAFAGLTPDHGLSFTRRSETGGLSDYSDGGSGSTPTWVRLTRTGDLFAASRSTDGTAWTEIGSATIAMGDTTYIGLASTSHNNSTLTTDSFDNVSVSSSSGDRTAPAISGVSASKINQNGASITWATDEPADSQIEYGTTTSYGMSTALNSSMVTAHSSVVSGLDAATTYHYRVKSRDAAGNLAVSADAVFRTPDEDGSSTPADNLAGAITTLAPARILDTRTNQNATGPVRAMNSITIPITGKGGIPTTGVSAVALNLTVTQTSTGGHIEAVPAGTTPTTSNLNFAPGQTIANLVIVPVGPDGKITLHNKSTGTVQLIADVAGYIRA